MRRHLNNVTLNHGGRETDSLCGNGFLDAVYGVRDDRPGLLPEKPQNSREFGSYQCENYLKPERAIR